MKPKFLAFSLLILLCFTRYTEGGLEISGNIGYCSGKHKFFNHESFQTLGLSFTLRSKLRSQVEIGFFYYPNYFGSSVSSLGNKRTSSAWNLNVSYLYGFELVKSKFLGNLAAGVDILRENTEWKGGPYGPSSFSYNFLGVELGGGLKYFLNKNFGLRIDFRYLRFVELAIFDDGETGSCSFFRLTGGIIWRH